MTLSRLPLAAALLLSASPLAADLYRVTSGADAGDGSLRAALLAAASGDVPATILIDTPDEIALSSGLVYGGTAPLAIHGGGARLVLSANETVLSVSQGADLTVTGLEIAGPGGFSIAARGDLTGPAGKGIFVDLREDQEGTVLLSLTDVILRDVAGHGVHVSDCSLADACGGGSGGAGEGSAAGIRVVMERVTVAGVGQGRFDADGLRVDERGPGSVEWLARDVTFTGTGADGVELDEGQAGDVIVTTVNARFAGNGDYCDPVLLAGFLPAEAEGEFDAGAMAEADIPAAITGSPDDGCFEREVDLYDDGSVEAYEFAIDTDDGFDVDEAGEGSIMASMIATRIDGNFDEGLDFDEEDGGDILLVLQGFDGAGNTDDAVKMSEAGDGSVLGTVIGARASDNGGVGLVFEEEDGGDVLVQMAQVATSANDGGELGVEIVQEDEGTGRVSLIGVEAGDGIEVEGVEMAGL